jgi:3-oxoacyl-(acyl-carrier-protein) synthase
LTLTQVYASRIAQSIGATDHITTDASACASSLKVMMDVQTLIDYYRFDRVVVLGIEDAVSNGVLEFFGEAKASLSNADEHSGKLPSAFDSTNGGFHVAQGSVFAVFESDRIADSGYAELVSAYTASEVCSNAIGQDADGAGFTAAIRGALEFKNITADSVTVVKTHGTGTQSNNQAERNSLNTVLPKYVATSYKPRIGHTMGVSGLLETCLLIDDLRSGHVPAIANRTETDSVFLSEPYKFTGGHILSIAAGMGNVYSAAIWRFIK